MRSLIFVTKTKHEEKRGKPEGDKGYREIKREIRKEMKMAKETLKQGQCDEVEVCIRKNNDKKAYQLVKDLTTENMVNLQLYKTSRGSISQRRMKSLKGKEHKNINDLSKAVLLLWFLTVMCSCCPYLYFGSAFMLVTYFLNFR